MTKSVNPPPNPEPQKPNPAKRLVNKLKSSPKLLAGGAIAIAAVGSLGYWGVQVLVKKKLPPFLESQIANIIERPIDLGEVEGFSLNSIKFGETVIPPTATDTDKVVVEEVRVGFNIFPVLFRRVLPLDVALVQPDIYLEQEQDGEWINLDFLQSDPDEEKKDPLLYFDVDLDIEEADITAVPYQQEALQAQVDGSGRFHQKKAFLEYDLDATIEQAKASIVGETKLETGSTNTKLLVEDLALSDAATLLPIPVEINAGTLNADLNINIPSFEEITAGNVEGTVNLQNLEGEATDLNAPISAESKLNFSGRNADVNQTQASLGNITAQVAGEVDLDTGYDLSVNVLPFQLGSIPSGIRQQLPVNVAGEVEAQVQLRGEIKDPQLTGNLNNTQTVVIARTAFRQINADFRANLAEVVLENVQITPVAGGSVTAKGTVETNLRQALESEEPIDATKMPLAFSFEADLPTQELILPYYQLPQQTTIGNLSAQGQVDGTVDNPQALVEWNIADAGTSNLQDIAGSGELVFANQNLLLRDTEISYGEGRAEVEANANLDNKQWQASLDADSLELTPFLSQFSNSNLNLDRSVVVNTATADLSGRLDQLEPEKIKGTADLNLNVDGGNVAVESQLNSGNIQAKAVTSNIQLDRFITSLPVATSIQSGEITVSSKIEQLLTLPDNPNLNSLNAIADLNLQVDGEAVAVNSQIDSGRIQANANTSQINLNRIAPNLPVPANIRSSQVTASGELEQLLSFAENPNLSTVDARVDADLGVANGTVRAIARLNNNQWQANVNANDISSQLLLDRFAPSNLSSVEVDNIDATADLSGSINPLINNQINIPVAVNQFTVNSGEQNVNARGNLTLSDVTSNLDVASNLNINANLDFDRLPIDQIVAASTQNNELVADSVNIRGQAVFDGQLNGQRLISAPTELSLTGDLRLLDFAFNDRDFDPVMTGTVNVQPQQEIALNLQGQQDVIAARAVPCSASDCKLPYLPTSLELRQGEDTSEPVIATGDRNGDIFSLDLQNFPLALLNLAPGQPAGIERPLAGTTTGEVDLNLYTLAANGNINVDNPAIGYIEADLFNADFNYDPANNVAEINSANLNLGESKYNLQAALDLKSGQINGKLDIPQAYIQDALTAFRWFTIEDVTNLFNIPDYAEPNVIRPAPEKDLVDRSIARKLNQLRIVNSKIQSIAAQYETGSIPTELNIDGGYQGEIILGGTIQTPKAEFRVEGNNWQWQPQPAYPDIVPPLGLVIEESEFISIPQLLIAGELNGTTVDLEAAKIQVQDAVLSLEGQLSPERLDTEYAVANLTVDNIGNFVNIPVDVTGEINTVGTIEGTLSNPQIAGKIAFTDGAFNGNILPAELAGNYNYDGSKLAFNTTAPEAIQVEATVPYPIIPGKSDRLTASANLDTEAFVFLDALSQNYLNWVGGEGNAQLEATARLDLDREGIIYDLDADGVVNLDNAQVAVQTAFFTEPFVGTGKITLNNQIVNVETLDAIFAEKDLSIAGKLPILYPVANLDRPLTVNLPSGDIDIEKLYKGGVAGEVIVTGASTEPVIGGEVTLEDGKVSIPQNDDKQEEVIEVAKTNVVNSVAGAGAKAANKAQSSTSNSKSSFVTALNDFKVNLKDFELKQDPLYSFQLKGDLTLNGTVDEPSNIIPRGKLLLTKADVDLFSTSFNAARNRDNTIIFTPEAGVFNPELDIILRTEVEDVNQQEIVSLRSVEDNSNEINDPISQGSDSETIRVSLVIDGATQEILPNLGFNNINCNIRPNNEPLVENNKYYSESELTRFTRCFNEVAYVGASDRNLINSPAVELTSTPSLDQGEIVNLLSGQFVAFARDVSNRSQSQLFDLGVNRFVIDPLLNSLLYGVESTTVSLGKKIGLDYLTIYPDLEGIYELNENSSLRFTYSHHLFTGLIESISLGNNNKYEEVDPANEVRLQYQLNF